MMGNAQSLWSEAIQPTIQSPWKILQPQAAALTNQTNGVLVGQVLKSEIDDGNREVLSLDIFVPALEYRHRVLSVTYHKVMLYPATVDAECFRLKEMASYVNALSKLATSGGTMGLMGLLSGIEEKEKKPINVASSDQELYNLIKIALQSSQVVSLAQSLIAAANDALTEREGKAQTNSSDSVESPNGPSGDPSGETPGDES